MQNFIILLIENRVLIEITGAVNKKKNFYEYEQESWTCFRWLIDRLIKNAQSLINNVGQPKIQ